MRGSHRCSSGFKDSFHFLHRVRQVKQAYVELSDTGRSSKHGGIIITSQASQAYRSAKTGTYYCNMV